MEKATFLYFRIATWFACHDPGTPVPEWCSLAWPMNNECNNELIDLYEKEYGRKIDSPEFDEW